MITPLYKPMKKNGTTMYVFPSVSEDKNFETQNDNYKMYLSHFVLVNFPKQVIDKTFDFENSFEQNNTSIAPPTFKDALVESLRNYVANHESVIRNSKINNTEYYYDTFEPATTTEKIFWKWCKRLNLINLEVADPINEYFGANPKYNNNGPNGNVTHFREHLWKERSTKIYDALNVSFSTPATTIPAILPSLNPGMQFITIQLTASTTFKPGDFIILNKELIDNIIPGLGYSSTQSLLQVIGLATNVTLNDTIIVEVDSGVLISGLGTISELEMYNSYQQFVQFISEIGGLNNVQLPDKSYTETFAYISHQHGQIPYALWNIMDDNNYKPNLEFPILPSEIQAEIQGGENPNNPILTNPSNFPGDIWGQFDTSGFLYKTETGNVNKRDGYYYGVSALNNISPTYKYPDFDGSRIDGLSLNLNIDDYAQPVSYIYPIETFNEYCATSFNNIAPKDFEFNAILWYYTIEDVTGNNTISATNLYGVEFLDTPENDLLFAKTKIPGIRKLVSNGFQDGNSFTFSLDTNITIDSDVSAPTFDPDKVYSLFGMELFYEALTRITYFNDQLSYFVNSNLELNSKVEGLTGLVYTQQNLESVRARMDNIENLLNIYSTLQIGDSDTITATLDTSSNPPLVRLTSIDKQYGYVYQFDTKNMYTEFTNINTLTQVNKVEKIIPVVSGKDFLTVVNNNDNSVPAFVYDPTVLQDKLSLVIEKDLFYKQKIDILFIPKINSDLISITNPVNHPINDKKLELYINYNDGTSNINIKQLLGEFSLPVLKNRVGLNIYDEPYVGLNTIPSWNIRNIYYSKYSTNDRIFSFVVEDDLIAKVNALDRSFVDILSRIYIDNFLLEENPITPGGTFMDLSSQYEVFNNSNNPTYVRDKIIGAEVVTPGTSYTAGTTLVTGLIYDGAYIVDVEVTANSSGNVTNVELINTTGLTTKDILDGIGSITIIGLGDNNATIKLFVKNVTRVNISMDINVNPILTAFLTNYDTITNIASLPSETYVNIDRFLKIKPILTFLKGYKISIVRISNVDLAVNLIDQRYNIKIDRL
jgi:hypothetical protein